MSDPNPQLVFVTGPQKGQRVVLGRPICVFGRGSEADVMLSEEFVSRLQFRYELLRAGATIENLSRKGTWINGSKYKTGKKVLLDAGDVIGVGGQTQILFVPAGQDPRAAVDAWKTAAAGGKDAFGRHAQAPGAASLTPPVLEPASQAGPAAMERQRRPSEMSADERAEAERKAKRRKLLVMLAGYWGLLMLLIVVGWLFIDTKVSGGVTEVTILPDDQIAEHLLTIPSRTPDLDRSADLLAKGKLLYERHRTSRAHLSEIVAAYKDAIAFSGEDRIDDDTHNDIYQKCLAALTAAVQQDYRRACLLEKNREWDEADRAFMNLLRTINDNDNPISVNIKKHVARVRDCRNKENPKQDRLFG